MQAAFFDLDKTVIATSSVLAFGRHFRREGLLSRSTIVKGLYAQVVYMLVGADEEKMERVREAMLALTKGWSRDHVAEIVRETFEETVTPLIYAEVLELMDEHRRAGRRIYIVSSSPDEIVRPIADHLDVDDAIATRGRLDDEGRYTGELDFYAYGPYKATAIRDLAEREGIDLAGSYAYSDSVTDLPMLEAVGNPVVVNPDKDLARVAEERGWRVCEFRHPVRLRDRMPVPPPGPTAAVGSVMALAGAAAVVAWALRRRVEPPSGLARVPYEGRRLAGKISARLPRR
ncbi:MAG TPA: HAD-IB family hydrolase [Acidimicrobiia bacterium]|nr:HAD-IB family hydrolase [Acidimicrobiia bacterium]